MQNHTCQGELGAIFNLLKPRLAISSHSRVSSYGITPILAGIRSQYPTGPLAVATDFDVWDVTATSVAQKRFLPYVEKVGYEFEQPAVGYDLPVENVITAPRPAVVAGGLSVFKIPGSNCSDDECQILELS